MKDSEVIKYITQRFDINWVETPIEYPNQRINTDGLAEWVRVNIRSYDSQRIGLKTGARRFGTLDVQVFTKVNTGNGRAVEIAEIVEALFKDHIYKTLVFKPCVIYTIGESIAQGLNTVKSGWYQVNCSIDYSFID